MLSAGLVKFTFFHYELYRMIDIAQVLTRLELIPLLNYLTMGFIKIILYALALGDKYLTSGPTDRWFFL